ncbi:MAG: RHS repeat-associated core domain-containing protein [Chloroflexi bacterium]|nr:RHS repeat-associated core domain-containing protein [Chloroflexota bacterium]
MFWLSPGPINSTLDLNAGLTQVLRDGSNTYLYGNGRIAQYQTAMQYFGADALGSVRQMYNTSGQIIANTRYDPYGNVVSASGATSVYGFTGEWTDMTGLTYLRARYYSAAQGRFTTRDEWEGDYNAPLSFNKWNYVQGNPINLTDPSGMLPRMQGVCPEPPTANADPTKLGVNEAFVLYTGTVPTTYVYCGEFRLTAYQFIDGEGRYPQTPVATASNLQDSRGLSLTFPRAFIDDVRLNGTGNSNRACRNQQGYFTVSEWDATTGNFRLNCGRGRAFDLNTDVFRAVAADQALSARNTVLYMPYVCDTGQPCRGRAHLRPHSSTVTVRDTGGES